MRKLRFLVPAGALDAGTGAIVDLPDEEARHLAVTLRAQPGQAVHLFDGCGREWSGEVVEAGRAGVRVRLLAAEDTPVESPLKVTVYQSLSVDRVFEESLEPLTALGVAVIVPLVTERSRPARLPDAKRIARWQRIAAEACKLSFRRVVPEIAVPATVARLVADPSLSVMSLQLDPDAPPGALRAALSATRPEAVRIAVGPEGGFSPEEGAALASAGFISVRLGPRVLRTQHAGAAAVALVLAAWSDLG